MIGVAQHALLVRQTRAHNLFKGYMYVFERVRGMPTESGCIADSMVDGWMDRWLDGWLESESMVSASQTTRLMACLQLGTLLDVFLWRAPPDTCFQALLDLSVETPTSDSLLRTFGLRRLLPPSAMRRCSIATSNTNSHCLTPWIVVGLLAAGGAVASSNTPTQPALYRG
jgi:hypothetical protein